MAEGKSDQDLLKEALSDTGAVAVLYERYRDRIFACLIRTVMDRDLAEELTEAVFVKMIDNLPKLARGRAPLVQWLFRVAHNEAISWFRHRHSADTYLATARVGDDDADPDYDAMVADAQDHEGELRSAAENLAPFDRECVTLRYGKGLTPREIAAMLGCSAKKVSNALQHAFRVLRAGISANPGGSRCPDEEEVRQ
ncbi:MAG: sigma-70 family RNA polymerase sigma factor [Caldisericota bacterium]|nr:sigma-70 family RNA polymerase sigma factor [Caldisericota bacterium]